jgi:hypothetical protein
MDGEGSNSFIKLGRGRRGVVGMQTMFFLLKTTRVLMMSLPPKEGTGFVCNLGFRGNSCELFLLSD